MKLLYCRKCQDVFKVRDGLRACACGASYGVLEEDGLHATYRGPCVPLGLKNDSLADAIMAQPERGQGLPFTAFVIPKMCKTFRRAGE